MKFKNPNSATSVSYKGMTNCSVRNFMQGLSFTLLEKLQVVMCLVSLLCIFQWVAWTCKCNYVVVGLFGLVYWTVVNYRMCN